MKRTIAAVGTGFVVVLVLLHSRGETPAVRPQSSRLPAAIGAIHPRLSPDGNSVAFSYQGAIWTAPRTGGTMTLLASADGFDTEPAWSPDGKRIAFVRGNQVKLVGVDDRKEVPLPKPLRTGGTYAVNRLEFSPDGRRLYGAFNVGGKPFGFAWFDLESGDAKSLAPVKGFDRFALSPDGKWFIHTSTADKFGEQQGGNDGWHTDVWKQPADGGKAEQVMRFPSRIHDFCFAADGRSLIVATETGGQPHDDLWSVPLDDSLRGMRRLTSGQADEDRASVSRDGKWLAYSDNRDGSTAIIVRDTATGEEAPVRFDRIDYRRPTGTLKLRVVDAATKQPVVARVSLREDGGGFHAPAGSLHRTLRGVGHFYCDGTAEMTIPAGNYRLKGFRGPEYKVVAQEIAIEPGQSREVTVELERWVHMAGDGWWSGEAHIHANYGYGAWFNTPETMRQQCVGEDLNVCNFMVANSDSDTVYDRRFFRGGPDPLSTPEYILYWNQEFRSTVWGHMTLLNLKQVVEPVFTGFLDTTNPWDSPSNADIGDRTHWQKGLVNYTHGAQANDVFKSPYAAKGIPIDAALGMVDTLDLNNSWEGSVPLWYKLLNCGFRIHATAGTDCFLNRIDSRLPGSERVYVLTGGPLDYAAWIDGLKAGRSFVTSGPMLEFTVNGSTSGSTVKLGGRGKVRVKASVRSQFPLEAAEVVHNGTVVAAAKLADDKLTATIDQDIALDEGGWLAFRARGPGTADTLSPTQNAHANPVYLEIAGKTHRSADDARAFLKWIDQLELLIRTRDRFPTPKHRQQVLEQLQAARKVYGEIIRETK